MKGTVFIFIIYLLNATNSSRIKLTLRPPNDEMKKIEIPKVTFVKRIVPHDYKSPLFEYDEKSRSIFVPKYRIRNRINPDLHEEFSSKEASLKQPYEAFGGRDDKEHFKTANNMTGHDQKLYYIVSGKDEETDLKPINRNVYEDNYNEYEKPWQADSRIFGSRWHQNKKRHPRNGSLDELVTTIQTNGEYKRNPKAKYNIYTEGPVWQTVEKNPRYEKRNIKSYLVDDLVKKLQEAVQSPRNAHHYSDDNKISSAKSAPYAVFILRNEDTKPDSYMNNLYELLQNPLSAEFRQVSDELVDDNERPKKQNIQALKNFDALLAALEKEEDGTVENKTKQRQINAERKSLESDISSNEAFQRPIERPKTKASNKLEDLLKTILGIEKHDRVDNGSSNESSESTEAEYPIDVIEKHKAQLMFPPLKSEKGRDGDSNRNLVMVVRNLGDLVKLWKHVQGAKNTKLRDRGTNSVVMDVEPPKVQGKPFNFPHYSIWNSWTYDKNLFHDNCPGEQAKVGDTCVWTPPHRK